MNLYLKKSKKLLLLLAVLPLFSLGVFGQQLPDSLKISLSLSQAQEYALEHNRSIQNASLDIKKAEASRWEAISTLLPQVNASLDYANYLGYEMNFGGMKIAMPPYGSLGITSSLGVSAAQIISIQLNNISMKMADISLKQSEQEISNQVKILYYSALVSEETVKLLEKNLVSMQKLHQVSEESVRVGVSEQVSADQLMVQVATMQTTLNSSKRSLEMIYNSMRLLLNLDADTEILLTQSLEDLMNPGRAVSLLSDEFILDNNYSYQLLRKSTEITKKQVDLAGMAYLPSFRVFHQYNAKKYFSSANTMNFTPPNLVGASIAIPIFSSGNRYKALGRAKIAYQKQLNTLADTESALQIQHRQLKYNLTSALERLETQKKNLEVTERVFNNISLKYEHGHSSSLEVTTASTNLVTAQSSLVRATLDFVNASIELEKLLNR